MCPPSGKSCGHVAASAADVRQTVRVICKATQLQRSQRVKSAARRARKRAALRQKQPCVGSGAAVSQPESLLIFLDWDDTMLPTSFLAAQQIGLESTIPPELIASFEEYAKVLASTLRCLQTYGRVLIVTNAETGWVELTCAKFLPTLVPDVAELPRVSARSEYEPKGFVGPVQWKTEAFVAQMERHFGEFEPSVLSLGDANHERAAVFYAAKRMETGSVKSIKLIEKPDLATLQREHALIQEHFPHLQGIPSLDVRLDDI